MSQAHHLSTQVLVIGAGGAGMYAALSAARAGAEVILLDKNMVGRGGATIMAQMTVAAALGEEEPDHWEDHLADTLRAGRGLCDESLAATVCEQAPRRMREMDSWGVGWAREHERIRQVAAPGHERARCCYVDFLNTGPAVAGTLRRRIAKSDITRLSDVSITDLVTHDGQIRGAVGLTGQGKRVTIAAAAVVIATGGLTKLYARSSASNHMGGEGYALALRAGAELLDMEFVQFFPIGHLAPRLVGMDPIMWDPFRYKLGGRLLNGAMEEFIGRYGAEDAGRYTVTRDLATYAIIKEAAAGRGSAHGGAYLSFAHLSTAALTDAFGPVIERLAANGIDLTEQPVEVAPIAHYHMGGIKVDSAMHTAVPGLLAAGEAVGGAGGANRLSGNAISEALVFGEIAGRSAATIARRSEAAWEHAWAQPRPDDPPPTSESQSPTRPALALLGELKTVMWEQAGPFRTETGLQAAGERIRALRAELGNSPPHLDADFANQQQDWYEARAALLVAETVTSSALERQESRGAHQREDHPLMDDAFEANQVVELSGRTLRTRFVGRTV